MDKTILVTGSTDGIGLETAKRLVQAGHSVLLHGRNPAKLADAERALSALPGDGRVESYVADLSRMADVEALVKAITDKHDHLDVLINNAGILKTPDPIGQDGFDVRFLVNTLAPYLLTQRLLPLLGANGRIINLSSAAQAPVDIAALGGKGRLADMEAYAQSKLALTMWSREMGLARTESGPAVIAVNPGSLLGSKMVKEGFGVAGSDIGIGADILVRAALTDEFADVSGQYYDNDNRRFADPHPDALDAKKSQEVASAVEAALAQLG